MLKPQLHHLELPRTVAHLLMIIRADPQQETLQEVSCQRLSPGLFLMPKWSVIGVSLPLVGQDSLRVVGWRLSSGYFAPFDKTPKLPRTIAPQTPQ